MNKIFAIFVLLCFGLIGFSQNISLETAQTVAANWYRHYAPSDKSQGSISNTTEYKFNEATNFYIFSFDKGGFVMVSANNQAEPILGYGFEGEVPEAINNPAVKNMFDDYARQIDTLNTINLKSAFINPKWESLIQNVFLKSTGTSVEPLLKAKWDQGCHYNEMCPTDALGSCGHALVGCTAVAMAQIMKFWNYPEKGIGQLDYIGKTNGVKYGRLSVFFNETNYDWSSMKDQLISGNNAVAMLLYHCGVSAKMDFGPTSSGAYLSNVASLGLVKYFDYAPSIMHIQKSDYTNESWLAMLKGEMDNGRPILYEGYNASQSSGHAFVCDGYQANDYFHFNFGWSGQFDGYFILNSLTPSWFTFTYYQGAIIGIKPNNSVLNPKFELKETPIPLQFQFIDYSTGAPSSWLWDFGDGTTSTEHNPIHAYSTFGNFKISLTVSKNGVDRKITIDQTIQAAQFSNLNASIGGIMGKVLWGDYDNDGDLDALLVGYPLGVKLYQNNNSAFLEVNTGIIGGSFAFQPKDAIWGDYDKDGDLDILLQGVYNYKSFTKLYRNDAGFFTEVDANLPGSDKMFWKDFDSDGDLDILLSNQSEDQFRSVKIFRNEQGKYYNMFTGIPESVGLYSDISWVDCDNDGDLDLSLYVPEIPNNGTLGFKMFYFENNCYKVKPIDLPLIGYESIVWGDYDNDGDLDFCLAGRTNDNVAIAKIFRNDNSFFTDINAKLEGVSRGSNSSKSFPIAKWMDFDNDGHLDLALTGFSKSGNSDEPHISKIYQNVNGIFEDIVARPDISYANALWIDFDNDGDLDVLSGNKLFQNRDRTFIETNTFFSEDEGETLDRAFGDFNNDGGLDFLTAGYKNGIGFSSDIYRNNIFENNSKPSIPTGLKAMVNNNEVTISWNPSFDDKTPPNVLTYNVFIGSHPDSVNVLSPLSDLNTGFGKVVQDGNAGHNKWLTIRNLQNGTYYASVQAIDHNYASSPFAAQLKFVIAGNNLAPNSNEINKLAYVITKLEFNIADFASSFVDPENNALTKIKITSLPQKGILSLDGITVGIGQEIFTNDIPTLSYKTSVLIDDSFQWKGFDGSNYSEAEGFVNISVSLYKDINAGIGGLYKTNSWKNSVCWGDYDNDGAMDLLIIGQSETGESVLKIFKNNAGVFSEMEGILPIDHADAASWGDFDNDGDLDLVIAGENFMGPFTKIFRNEKGNFDEMKVEILGVRMGMLAWSDYDNDGDLDLTISGIYENNSRTIRIYRNDNGTFVDIQAALPSINVGAIDWGDWDNDGDLDILMSGSMGTVTDITTKVFRNDNGKFIDLEAPLMNLYQSSSEWGDYNNDGKLDLLFSGIDENGLMSLRTSSNDFLMGLQYDWIFMGGSAKWVDYDSDGDLDIFFVGSDNYHNPITKLYQNDNGLFSLKNIGLQNLRSGTGSFADIDNDGDLDLFLMGQDKDLKSFSGIFTNCFGSNAFNINTAPSSPINLNTLIQGNDVIFSWEKANDNQTAQQGITYNFCVGSKENSVDIVSPMSNFATGYRQVMQIGNTGFRNSYTLKGLKPGTYYWSVQAIDNNYLGGKFTAVQSFKICDLPSISGSIVGLTTVCQGQNSVTYTVPTIANAISYIWNLPAGATGTSTTNSITVDYSASTVSGEISVKGHNDCGDGAASSKTISVNAIPQKPIVTQNGDVLHSDATSGNQWYYQNGLLSGATSQDYTPKSSRDYYVVVSRGGCTSEPSNSINFISTGLNPDKLAKSIKVYPNPVLNELIIEFQGNTKNIDFEVINAAGQMVFSGILLEKEVVQTSDFTPGVYIVKLKSGDTFEFKKVLKN